VHVAQNQVFFSVYHFCLIVRLLAPQHEHDAGCLLVNCTNHIVCKLLPPFLLMTITLASLDCQNSIEQEHTLSSPVSQISVQGFWHGEINFLVIHQAVVDLLQTWGTLSGFRD
jgi:hypothetical protein